MANEFKGRGEQGFTLIELMVVVSLVAVVSTISMMSLLAYNKSSDHKGAARETVALLRNAQVKSVTEARTYECTFTATRLQILGPAGLAKTYNLPSNLQFVAAAPANGFTHSATSGNPNCFFYAKGSATPGSVVVKRLDTSATRKVVLEALTGRVSYCADPTPATPCAAP